jgi:hypothetical protein
METFTSPKLTERQAMSDVLPPLTYQEATQVVEETALAPRISAESIRARIAEVRYQFDGISTICIIEMKNGFKVFGHSTPASPANFNAAVGKSYAYDNAFRQIWQLEGYLLREFLFNRERGLGE